MAHRRRTICAYPTTDPNQIKALFGTEVEHIDQLVLLEKAKQVPDARAEEWLRGGAGALWKLWTFRLRR